MRFDDYVAARRTRLVEHTVALGVAEDAAPALVDATLEQHRRQVQRADDPDPLMYAAVARAAAPTPATTHRRGRWIAAALVLVVLAGAGLWRLWPTPDRVAVPTLFGFGATAASRTLRDAGFDVAITTVPVCEPPGLVLGSSPAGGARAEAGSTVELRSAISPDDVCRGLADRAAAWAFVAFARGGPAPDFADRVNVVVDGSEPAVLADGDAADRDRWGGLLRRLDAVYGAPARSGTSTPQLVVRSETPPARQCGTERPPQGGEREALRLQVQPDPEHVLACPLTVDLFRSGDGTIDSVVVYSPDYDGVSKWS